MDDIALNSPSVQIPVPMYERKSTLISLFYISDTVGLMRILINVNVKFQELGMEELSRDVGYHMDAKTFSDQQSTNQLE
jgi:hypothetical protein